jgi:rhamnosyltransferase
LKISVIIPTKNGGALFANLLRAIDKQRSSNDIEIIVVDSGSRDNTVDMARKFGATVITIPAREFSHGRSRNIGAAAANGSYLVFCNQDMAPANDLWLKNLLAPLEEPQVAGAYSRQIVPPSAPRQEQLFLRHFYPEESKMNSFEMTKSRGPEEVVLFSTVSGALRSYLWRRFRFDESVVMSEDQEIAYRMLLAGHMIAYQADSVVYHYHDYSLQDLFRRFFDSGWSMTYFPEMRVNSPVKSSRYFWTMVGEIASDGDVDTYERVSSLVRFFVKTLGFSLGQLAPYLPPALCVMLSHTKKSVAS